MIESTIEKDYELVLLSSEYCTARSKQTGQPCRQRAIPGGSVCRFHGGAAPQTRRAAATRLSHIAALAMDRLIARLEFDAEADPLYQIDPKVLTEIIDKSTKLAQLLSGQATERRETRSTDVKLQLSQKLDNMATRLGLIEETEVEDAEVIEEDD